MMHSLFDSSIPVAYRAFFLVIEPMTTLLGAGYDYFAPQTYLSLLAASASLNATSVPASPPDPATLVAVYQLANMYLMFTLNEALVLACTQNRFIWRVLLFGLLIADIGHLATLWGLGGGFGVYWRVWEWNEMGWGGVGAVYLGASMRAAFIANIGMGKREDKQSRKQRVIKKE